MIAVTFALPTESSDFIRLLGERSRKGDVVRGNLHEQAICVLHTGVGEKVARIRVADYLLMEKPELLISAGFAGATTNRLHTGDLFLAENYGTVAARAVAMNSFVDMNVRSGRLATAASVVDGNFEREELARTSGAIAVDMETESIAEVCAVRDVPMLSLRVISDTPAAPMPAPAHVLFDLEQQRTNVIQLGVYLVRHPSAIPRLIAFAKRIAAARQTLARALDAVIRDTA